MIRRMFFSLMSVLLISGILSSAIISNAVAAPITVDSTSDSNDGVCGPPPEDCTLREAIHAVNAGMEKRLTSIQPFFLPVF